MRRVDLSRRNFVKASTAGLVTAAVGGGTAPPVAAQSVTAPPAVQVTTPDRILLKGGVVLSLDPTVGDFERADVLIEGTKIVAIQPNLQAQAQVIDAAHRIVMPGFIQTHQHQYQTILRGILADGVLTGPKSYFSEIQDTLTPAFRPEDARIAELVCSLSQINAGITTGVDISQIALTPEHTDACLDGLRHSGRRTLFAYWLLKGGPGAQYPQDIRRIRTQYFASSDQLLTLGLGALADEKVWAVGRDLGVPIISHMGGAAVERLGKAGQLGPDNEYIHCMGVSDAGWQYIADTGGKVSIATAIEMQMGHGTPPIQQALDHGVRVSLSADVETNMAADMFTMMRATYTLQRLLVHQRAQAGEKNLPRLLTCRDVVEMATINGAWVSHLDTKVGTLTPGKEADILLLRTDAINVFPVNNVPAAIVTLMDTSNVDTVLIAGKIVKRDGRLVGVDVAKIRKEAEAARDGLLARVPYPTHLFQSCCRPGQ